METYLDLKKSMDTFSNGRYQRFLEGVRVWKLAEDLARYRWLIEHTSPEVVVETGTKWGGSALWFANQGLQVVTVDNQPQHSRIARERCNPNITWIVGDSVSEEIPDSVHQKVQGKRTMVVLDSDHHKQHVMKEITLYGPLVSYGCHLVVEDGIFDLAGIKGRLGGKRIPEEGGPLAAIEQLLAHNSNWQRNTRVERMYPVTHHPAGWWRCVSQL